VVSHDIRNPLNVAQGLAELLANDCDSEHLVPIVESLDRMEALVSETEPIGLVNLVGACWQTVPTAEATVEIEDEVTITGDRDRLQHVFENLFRNAIEHGGADVTVRVGSMDDRGIYVGDTGPGIAEAHGWQVEVLEGTDGGARFEFTGMTLD